MQVSDIIDFAQHWLNESGYRLPGTTITPSDARDNVKSLLGGIGFEDVTSDGGVTASSVVTKTKRLLAGYRMPYDEGTSSEVTITEADAKNKIRSLLHTIGMVDVTSDGGVTTSSITDRVKTLLQDSIVQEADLSKITDSDITTQAQRWLADEGNNQWDSTELTALVTMAMDRFRADRGDALHSDGDACKIHLDTLAHLVCYYAFLDDSDDQNNATLAEFHLARYKEAVAALPSTWTSADLTTAAEHAQEQFKTNRRYLLNQTDDTIPSHYESALAYLTCYIVLSRGPQSEQQYAQTYYQTYQNAVNEAQPAYSDTGIGYFLEMAKKQIINDAPDLFQSSGEIEVPSTVGDMNTLFEDAIVYYTAYALASAVSNEATQFYQAYQQARIQWPAFTPTEISNLADDAIEMFKVDQYHVLNPSDDSIPSRFETTLAHLTAYLVASRSSSESGQASAQNHYQIYQTALGNARPVYTDTQLDSFMEMAKQQIVNDAPHLFHSNGDLSMPSSVSELDVVFENALVQYTAYLAASPVSQESQGFLNAYRESQVQWPKRFLTTTDYEQFVTLAVKELLDRRPDLLLQENGSLLDRRRFSVVYLDDTWMRPIAARVCHDALVSSGTESGKNMIQYFESIWKAAA